MGAFCGEKMGQLLNVCVYFICFLQLIEAIQGVDKIIGHLMNGLKQIGLHRCLNIIIVADHGNTQYVIDMALFKTNK